MEFSYHQERKRELQLALPVVLSVYEVKRYGKRFLERRDFLAV